ncbi:MAG TPA: T9SS type A sorting domain-containing protein [Candidatus Kapabacteria bacterium]|nr:T9SS type A sorting domain-containing protein [Candidatus Kapabacteria bacterium]
MKNLIIVAFLLLSSNLLFSKLEFPDVIDLGEIALEEVDTTKLYSDKSFDVYYPIYNNSINEYYILNHNYKDSKDFPYIANFVNPVKLRENDSLYYMCTVLFPAPKIKNFYDSTFYIKSLLIYRNVDSLHLDTSEITFKFKVIKVDGYKLLSDNSQVFYYPDFNRAEEAIVSLGSIKNYLEDFNIDSIKLTSDLNKITGMRVTKSNTGRTLPLRQQNMEQIRLEAKILISEFRNTKINIEIFGKYVENLKDTVYSFSYVFKPRLYENYIMFNTFSSFYASLSVARNSKDGQLPLPPMSNFTSHEYTINNIELIADHREYVKVDDSNLPIELPKIKDSTKFSTAINLGRILISTPDQPTFKNNVLIKFYLEDDNGYQQTESVYFMYYVDGPSSIIDGQGNNSIIFSPNPATDFITINYDYEGNGASSSALIYDILGVKVAQEPLINGNNKINISHLTHGVYFIKIGDRVEKFIKI